MLEETKITDKWPKSVFTPGLQAIIRTMDGTGPTVKPYRRSEASDKRNGKVLSWICGRYIRGTWRNIWNI
jgi:hypothetical protein